MENNKYYWAGLVVAVIIIAGGAYYYSQKTAPVDVDDDTATTTDKTRPELITAKHQFKNGNHIIAGETNLPTICDLLNQNVSVAESFPEQVTLQFTTTNKDPNCLERVTPVRFRFDFGADEKATIKATWNGAPVELNLIPVGPDEDLTNFEVEVKG